MKILLSIGFGICWPFISQAQMPTLSNSLYFSVSKISIDSRKVWGKPAIKFEATYAKHLSNNRTLVKVTLGYLNHYEQQQFSPYPLYYKGDQAQRISATFLLLYDLLKSPVHAFRIGGGLSGWYQNDDMVSDLTVFMNSTMTEITSTLIKRSPNHRVSAGYVLTAEYEYTVTSNIMLGAKIEHLGALIYPYESAIPPRFSMAGLSIGYRF